MPRRREFAYLTTMGRRSGREHTVELWFGVRGDTIYFLSGGGDRADWLRNARANPRVKVRLGRTTLDGRARATEDRAEELTARQTLATKYESWVPGKRLSAWARSSLPLAVDLPRGALADDR
ncbi:MAG TPA: nitroreductase family deazaflavin-dependent oxidoreductase [Candidatus Dormibacteraeota bacterium]|nr:nitroreductase family deazaflavin-dependent oxidoreductase [Candidatus Dormibacteraeota bacterium]